MDWGDLKDDLVAEPREQASFSEQVPPSLIAERFYGNPTCLNKRIK